MDSLQELYEIFGHLLPERLLAPSDEGVNSRKRIFSSRVTFWAFAAQVLNYHLLTKPRKEMKIHGHRNRPKVKHPKTSLS